MELSENEFKIVNSPIFRFIQKYIELPVFKKMGFDPTNKSVLEIGCGSGHGAFLISDGCPESYIGIDMMPEQIQIAQERSVKNCEFILMDASDLRYFPDESKDIIVIFRILHHIPKWKNTVRECNRVLKPGGEIYVTEPYGVSLKLTDGLFNIEHPKEAMFSAKEFNMHLKDSGFEIRQMHRLIIFAACGKKITESRGHL